MLDYAGSPDPLTSYSPYTVCGINQIGRAAYANSLGINKYTPDPKFI